MAKIRRAFVCILSTAALMLLVCFTQIPEVGHRYPTPQAHIRETRPFDSHLAESSDVAFRLLIAALLLGSSFIAGYSILMLISIRKMNQHG